MYKRPPTNYKKSMYSNKNKIPQGKVFEDDIAKNFGNIPLPNEDDIETRLFKKKKCEDKSIFPFKIFGMEIGLDEIIIFGLIFLLLQEKVEDEFLIIILVYILLL